MMLPLSNQFRLVAIAVVSLVSSGCSGTSSATEEAQAFFVGKWSFDMSDTLTLPEPKSAQDATANQVIKAMLANCTMELQRDGVAVQTVPMFEADGSDTRQNVGTWELSGSGPDLKLKLNLEGEGAWIPIRRDSEDQFTQLFPKSTRVYKRKK